MKTYIMYEIKCNDVNVEFNYVGHTTNFRVRKNSHKTNCNNENSEKYNSKIYKCIRENGNFDNWTMSPLEEYECETTIQARIREQYWMDIKQSKLNMLRAHTTAEQRKEQEKEYYNSNINRLKQYQLDNKEHIKEFQIQYRINNKTKIQEYHNQYKTDNKEHLFECSQKYHNENREAILERKKQIIVCECGINTTQSHKPRHMRTARHLELMSKLNL